METVEKEEKEGRSHEWHPSLHWIHPVVIHQADWILRITGRESQAGAHKEYASA